MRIIVDTNLWISFLISNKLKVFGTKIQSADIVLVLSDELIHEVFMTAVRPKFNSFIGQESVKQLKLLFSQSGVRVKVVENVKICRDPKDDFLLSLAVSGAANFLLTGDKDLLVLNKIGETRIITYSEWVKLNER